MDHFLIAAAIAYTAAGLAGPGIRRSGWVGTGVFAITLLAIPLSPLVVPVEHSIFRGLAALMATELTLKLIDYRRCVRTVPEQVGSLGRYLRFLVPFPVFLVTFQDREHRRSELRDWPRELGGLALAAAGVALGVGLMVLATHSAWLRHSYPLDHACKLVIVVILIESAGRFVHQLERLSGYDTTAPMLSFVLSRTVGEFWYRWNTRVQTFLQANVFQPSGGRRAPLRGIFASFFWSGVLHEVMFGIATARWDGYQLLFFLIQVPPVLASRDLERFAHHHGWMGKFTAHGLTIGWITVTSVLFFHAVDRVFPFFYVSKPWLP